MVMVDDVPGEFAERVIEAFIGRPQEIFTLALSGGAGASEDELPQDHPDRQKRCDAGNEKAQLRVMSVAPNDEASQKDIHGKDDGKQFSNRKQMRAQAEGH